MKYILTLEVLDNSGNQVEKTNSIKESDKSLTVGELKQLMNNGKYTNIESDEFNHHGKDLADNELVNLPFIHYTIKLK
jgi:hypothetical protein